MYKVVKRNGDIVAFDIKKIESAILRAFVATNKNYNDDVIQMLALRASSRFADKVKDDKITIEDIQDSVETVLAQTGYEDVAKAYILYRKQHEKVRLASKTLVDYKKIINSYLGAQDWRVKENSTVNYSIGGLILSNSGAVTANYWLSEIYDDEIGEAHRSAAMHLHDLSMLSGYCAGWSLKQLIKEGLGGVEGKISSSPAKHLSTLCNQMVNFIGIMQNEWAGAQAFSSFDTYLAAFVKADNLSYREVKQCIESFVFGVNTPSRWGTQAPFSNITLDWTVPEDLKNLPAIVGGKEMDFTYADCKKEMDMVNKAFLEIMIDGDANGRGFQYPIPTYSLTKDFDWSDTENNRLLFEMTSKYGTPYFSNYIGNTEMQPSDVRSMCCRLRLDLRELRKKSGGFFGSGESTGSIGVVTLNMPRIAYLATDEADFYKRLDALMDIAARSLKVKREVVTKYLENGLYPYTKRYLGTFNNHFSTIGLVGMNETCLNAKWIGKDLTNKEAQKFSGEVLDHMREKLSDYQEKYGDLYNLEATPAESTAYRLAKHDKERYPDIITAGTEESPYYTNSSNLPVGFTDDIFEAMDIQDPLQTKYTSGTVFHVFLGQKVSDWKSTRNIVRKIAENHELPYFTMSPTYSICREHGYITGEVWQCPICHKPTEVYSRITGYYRPIKNWNVGKTQEFKDRKEYKPSVPENGKASAGNGEIMLFTTKSCPNCPIAKKNLANFGIEYTLVDAEENPELAAEYGIMSVPTLVAGDTIATGVSQIIGWARENGKRA
ncbi:MAG: ribonucleoside triphosphate reductase [Sphaerochaetaceae bacterium]|nr:ribonucleoside triphosphate reductase [Sphaerochaetaceae bacterium]